MINVRSPHLRSVMQKGNIMRVNKGGTLTTSDTNNHFYYVKSGFVKRYRITAHGNLGVQIIYGPQDVFSFTSLFKALDNLVIYDGPETYYYGAMSPVEVYVLQTEQLIECINKTTGLYRELLHETGCHLKTCVHNIENISIGNANVRVAHQLFFLARNFGRKENNKIVISVPLTHQDIADILGLTRETVSKSLSELKKQGVIGASTQLTINNLEKLTAAAHPQI